MAEKMKTSENFDIFIYVASMLERLGSMLKHSLARNYAI